MPQSKSVAGEGACGPNLIFCFLPGLRPGFRIWGCDPLHDLSAWGHVGSSGVEWGRMGSKPGGGGGVDGKLVQPYANWGYTPEVHAELG